MTDHNFVSVGITSFRYVICCPMPWPQFYVTVDMSSWCCDLTFDWTFTCHRDLTPISRESWLISQRAGFEVPLDKPPAPKPTLGSKRGGAKKKGKGAKKKVSVEAHVDWVIHVILDARTRREHPSASTHLELSVPVERTAFRDCKWVLQEVNQKLNVPALGLR